MVTTSKFKCTCQKSIDCLAYIRRCSHFTFNKPVKPLYNYCCVPSIFNTCTNAFHTAQMQHMHNCISYLYYQTADFHNLNVYYTAYSWYVLCPMPLPCLLYYRFVNQWNILWIIAVRRGNSYTVLSSYLLLTLSLLCLRHTDRVYIYPVDNATADPD